MLKYILGALALITCSTAVAQSRDVNNMTNSEVATESRRLLEEVFLPVCFAYKEVENEYHIAYYFRQRFDESRAALAMTLCLAYDKGFTHGVFEEQEGVVESLKRPWQFPHEKQEESDRAGVTELGEEDIARFNPYNPE